MWTLPCIIKNVESEILKEKAAEILLKQRPSYNDLWFIIKNVKSLIVVETIQKLLKRKLTVSCLYEVFNWLKFFREEVKRELSKHDDKDDKLGCCVIKNVESLIIKVIQKLLKRKPTLTYLYNIPDWLRCFFEEKIKETSDGELEDVIKKVEFLMKNIRSQWEKLTIP